MVQNSLTYHDLPTNPKEEAKGQLEKKKWKKKMSSSNGKCTAKIPKVSLSSGFDMHIYIKKPLPTYPTSIFLYFFTKDVYLKFCFDFSNVFWCRIDC